jgi:hypothetical protein
MEPMTHESIEALIHLLNQTGSRDRQRDRMFVSALNEWVDFVIVWREEPRGGIAGERSARFYFIKDNGQYVAVVYDMDDDLHAVTLPSHRGRGLVTKALDDVILPKLWHEGRGRQTVTFENHDAGARFARRLGFVVTEPGKAEKDLSVYASRPPVVPIKRPLSRSELSALRIDIARAKLYVTMVKERLDLAYGDTADLYLDEIIYEELGTLDDQCEDFMERAHRRLGFPSIFGYRED